MQRFLHKYIFHISLSLFVVSSFVFANQVLAVGRPAGVGAAQDGTAEQQFQRPETPPTSSPQNTTGNPGFRPENTTRGSMGQSRMPAFAQTHLASGKLRACQVISQSLTTRSQHMNDLVMQMEKTFDSIAQGIENHYLTQLVPQGKVVPNYDALVADIQTQKSGLLPLLQALQTDLTNFSCTGNNPAAQMGQYRTDMQAVIKGLQSFRTAVRKLIVAVATVEGVTEQTNQNQTASESGNQETGRSPFTPGTQPSLPNQGNQ